MLELIAQVEPMALPLWAVLVFSAAMYPIGFLFGTCSECCEACPGSLCHFHSFDGFQSRPLPLYPNIEMSIGVDGLSTDVVYDPQTSFGEYIGRKSLSIAGTDGGFNTTVNIIDYYYEIDVTATEPCGPTDQVATYAIRFIARFFSPDFGELGIWTTTTGVVFFESGPCEPFSLADFEFSGLSWDNCISCGDGTIYGNVQDYLSDQVPTGSISFDACECGACCFDDGDLYFCTDDVAEQFCDSQFESWQGSGTECDPNPCPQPGA